MGKIWDGVQSLPLELKLFNMDGNYVIQGKSCRRGCKIENCRAVLVNNVFVGENDENILNEVRGRVLKLRPVVDVSNAGRVNVVFGKGNDERWFVIQRKNSKSCSVFKDSGISSDTISVKLP